MFFCLTEYSSERLKSVKTICKMKFMEKQRVGSDLMGSLTRPLGE